MTGVKISPLVASQPIVDPKTGLPSDYFMKTFLPYFLRLGGYTDLIYQQQLAANTGDATLAEVASVGDDNSRAIAALRAQIASGLIEALQQDNEDLRRRLDTLQAVVSGGLAESLQQEISDLRQEQARLNAQIQGIRGEDAAAQVQQVQVTVTQLGGTVAGLTTTSIPEGVNLYFTTGRVTAVVSGTYATIASISAVGFTGAYADLTGKPTLGTAASQNTGTSGSNVPLLNGANTWASRQTFNGNIAVGTYTASAAPPITGYITIEDAAGNTRNLAVV